MNKALKSLAGSDKNIGKNKINKYLLCSAAVLRGLR